MGRYGNYPNPELCAKYGCYIKRNIFSPGCDDCEEKRTPISISYDHAAGILSMSVDIRIGAMPLPPGEPDAPPYVVIPSWPIDPSAPVINDPDEWDEEY